MNKALEKKLLITAAKNVVFINAPLSLGPVPVKKDLPADVVLVFVSNNVELSASVDQAISSLSPNGVLWFAYPKKTSGIVTNINRDMGWEVLDKNKFIAVTQVAIDETWSALRFKPIDKVPKLTRKAIVAPRPTKSSRERTLELPTELKSMLVKSKQAAAFFQGLSFTNRKEYITWLESAKKPETKQKRLILTAEKLLAGKKNPSEK